MADYEADEQVRVPEDVLFDYLSDIENLPKYFPHMTSAEPAQGTDGEAVDVTAKLDDGSEVEGEAWFKVDDQNKTIAWGSEGPNNYHGHMTVTGVGDNSAVAVTLTTEHAEGREIQEGVNETVHKIKTLLEEAHPRPHYDGNLGLLPE